MGITRSKSLFALALLLAVVSFADIGAAQTNPAAVRPLQLSAFGGVGGVYTGLGGGKNFAIIAGADLGLPPWRGIRPTLEVRGLYPSDHGLVDSEKSLLGGLKVDTLLHHRLQPYGDFLFGRGQMNYGEGYIYGNTIYSLTTTNVYSPGAGFDYQMTDSLAIRVDGQYQRWGSTPTSSGVVYSKVGTASVVYRFNFGRFPRR